MICGILNLVVFLISVQICSAIVREWGENCTNASECSDHRYDCLPDLNNVTKCFCDRFHEWGGSEVGCVQIYNYSTILNMSEKVQIYHYSKISSIRMKAKNDFSIYEKQRGQIFQHQLIAGLFVIAAVFFATVSVTAFCIFVRRSDDCLKKSVKKEGQAKKTQTVQPSISFV